MDRERENAHRLAGALERNAENPGTVSQLARILNYEPEQLRQDMTRLLSYIIALEAARSR